MKNKSRKIQVVFSFAFFVLFPVGSSAASIETNAFSSGFSAVSDSNYTLESTVGEVSGSSMTAGAKALFPGHSGNSHTPGVAADLAVSTLSKTEVRFDWTEKGNDGTIGQAAYVEIKVATFPVTYSNYSTVNSSITLSALSAGSLRQQIYSGLSPGSTYYVAIRVVGRAKIPGRIYSDVSFYTEPVKPKTPLVSGVLSGNSFIISWEEVNSNVDGDAIEIKNYEVYYSTSLTGTVYGPVNLSSSTLSYIASLSPKQWYFVKAVDAAGVRSGASLWLSNSDETARTVADDNNALVEMSPTLNASLSSSGLSLQIVHKSGKESGDVLSAYYLYIKNSSGDLLEKDLAEDVTLILPLSGSESISVNSIRPSVSYTNYDYAVFFYNGVEDVKLGGTVNPSAGTISVLTKKTGLFKVKRVVRAQGFTVTQTVPRKIFTPNGDGKWDEFNIIYENPQGLSVSDAKVYDLGGREIADLKAGTYNSGFSLMWDGRKKEGGKAAAGIYIYQFKAGDRYYNGTVVLAR